MLDNINVGAVLEVDDILAAHEGHWFVRETLGMVEPGKFANWISPPTGGINRQPVDCNYVRFNLTS